MSHDLHHVEISGYDLESREKENFVFKMFHTENFTISANFSLKTHPSFSLKNIIFLTNFHNLITHITHIPGHTQKNVNKIFS